MLSRFVVSQVKHNSYFLCGLALGLWLALAVVPLESGEGAACDVTGAVGGGDEYEPVHEARPAGGGGGGGGDTGGGVAPARALQRPRYYTTELGMRAPLLAAVLSSEDALGESGRAAALNATLGRLRASLRFFMAASAPAARGLTNVVGFTDTREMLRPFHALKYLADNYLDEFEFFFLVSDASFVNARRLAGVVAALSVSEDVYMGARADDDSHYCTLEGGILLSNSVVRAVHASLDWCVRNSYSAQHHENVGRCVAHAANVHCTETLQGVTYSSVLDAGGAADPGLAAAVTAHPVTDPRRFHQLHALVARTYLQQGRTHERSLRSAIRRTWRRPLPGYTAVSWPAGLRTDPTHPEQKPGNRWDHLRWTAFNTTHTFMPDEHHSVAPLSAAHNAALKSLLRQVTAWGSRRWDTEDISLVEGSFRWRPAAALEYRLLLRAGAPGAGAPGAAAGALHWVEAVRPLGAARLVPVPYVTESARVWVVLPVRAEAAAVAVAGFLRRYEAACLQRRGNTALVAVFLHQPGQPPTTESEEIRSTMQALINKYRSAAIHVVDAEWSGGGADGGDGGEGRAALDAAGGAAPRDALMLLADARMDFNEDFLNRARMHSVPGSQWYLPVPFARYAQYEHPRFVDSSGQRPQLNTGRFNPHHVHILAVHRQDYERARASAPPNATVAEFLSTALRCVHAPEPGLVLAAPPPPCGALHAGALEGAPCRAALRGRQFRDLDLGARHTLAKLLLEIQSERE